MLKASALAASGRFLNAGSLDPQVVSVRAEDAEKIRRHVEDQARRVAAWPRVPWMVAGVQVQVAVWRFAGGWIAVCDAVRDAPVVGVGVAADPVGLQLEVVDGTAYGVDFASPTTLADLRRRTPEMAMPRPTGDPPHPDVQALLATL
ncbi:hypothetical protein DMH01_15455 [Amycolatopsis sp. WAC 04182]|nr:hypothetical protein DMH01_15455 [Amycolatopsis sp. WAC 04182]